jgi:hypothetical protein
MAQEAGYERQLGPARPSGLPGANPAAFGAGVGAAVAQAGGMLHETALRADAIERQLKADQEGADAAVRFAEARGALDAVRDTARANAAKGGAGHVEAMTTAVDGALGKLTEGVTDRRLRQQLTAQAASYRAQFLSGEHAWQVATAARAGVQDLKTLGELASARVRTSSDPNAYRIETEALDAAIEVQGGIGEDARTAVKRELHGKLAIAHAGRVMDENPAGLLRTLDSGAYNDVLDGGQVDALRAEAEARVRRDEAAQRAEQAHQRAVMGDTLAARAVELDAGAGSVQDRLALATQYEALGDQSKAAEWKGKAQSFAAVQGSRDWTLPQMDRRIAELSGKQGQGKLTGPEAAELKGLTEQRGASASRLNQPGGALLQLQYATGRPLQPVDPQDPASMRARAATAAAAARAYGRFTVEPLTETELPVFRDLVEGGPAQKLAALDVIRGFGDPRAIAGAARQIGGADDGDFRIAATLPRDVARDVLLGREALKANGALWAEAKAQAVLRTYYSGALRWLPTDYQADLFQAAKGYFASRAQRGGEAKWDDKRSPGLFAEAIEAAMGRHLVGGEVRGGVLRRPQGIVIVPADMAPAALDRAFARATPEQYAEAAGGRTPRWPDGGAISVADFKGRLLPTALGGGRYAFRAPDGRFVDDDRGQRYTVDLAKLTRR